MACLLQLPQTTSRAYEALSRILRVDVLSVKYFNDQNHTFSSTYPTTMKALLAVIHDNAKSAKIRAAVIRALLDVLGFERRDTILKLGTELSELLAMDSNPTLERAIAGAIGRLYECNELREREFIICEGTKFLEVLMGLLVSGKDYDLRKYAGWAVLSLCRWKLLALKIAIIPHALLNLFTLFLSKETLHTISSIVGSILLSLACVSENRSKFRGLKESLEGLGDILVTLGGLLGPQSKEKRKLRHLEY